MLIIRQLVFGTSFCLLQKLSNEIANTNEVSALLMAKSRGRFAGMRIACGHYRELTVAFVDQDRKEEAGMAGQTFRREFHDQPTGVVLKYIKGG